MGDPFLGKFFKKIRRFQPGKFLKPLAGMLPGPLGMIGGMIGAGGGQPGCPSGMSMPFMGDPQYGGGGMAGPSPFAGMGHRITPGARGGPSFDWAGLARGAANVAGMFLPGVVGAGVRAVTGMLPGGAPAAPAMLPGPVVRRGGFGRRYRRTNPGNVKALRRSIRRVKSFVKLARQTVGITRTVRLRKGRKR